MIKRYNCHYDIGNDIYEDQNGEIVFYNSVEHLERERNAYYNCIMTLIVGMENEFQKDGWCRLVVTKEKLDDIKKLVESMQGA
jgi:hypothetical protein